MPSSKPVDISSFRHLYPFKSHFLIRNGLAYHYLDEGTGDPVVMVHGNPTWSFYYRALVKTLSREFRIIVPDHIGCGLSDKPNATTYDYRLHRRIDDLEALMDHLGLESHITLVLHDWGGAIGMGYALRKPERIKRCVIMNTAAFFHPKRRRLPFRLWVFRHFSLFSQVAVLGLNLFAWGASVMASQRRLPKDVRVGLTAPYNCWKNRIATLRFVQDIPIDRKDPSYGLLEWIDTNLYRMAEIPMLICWGLKDFVFDADFLAEWQRRFPDAEVHSFSNAGHYILEDVPEKIVDHVLHFLRAPVDGCLS